MKIIVSIVSGIITLAVMAAITLGCIKLYDTYGQAKTMANMDDLDRYCLYIGHNDTYQEFLESYIFIKEIPLLGDTLCLQRILFFLSVFLFLTFS